MTVVGFAGVWLMVDEAHITTFGVHPDWRRQGIGRQLLLNVAELSRRDRRAAHDAGGAGFGNPQAAQGYTAGFGFAIAGTRVPPTTPTTARTPS